MPASSADEVAAPLYRAVSLLARRLRMSPVASDLSPSERSALARLDHDGPATTAALARAEQVTAQAMSAVVTVLAARNFVARSKDPADGRQLLVALTEAGAEVLRAKRDARTSQVATALHAEFTPAELAVLAEAAPLLERLGRTF
jgi:DNA-binding MarR family transcriptional regulator